MNPFKAGNKLEAGNKLQYSYRRKLEKIGSTDFWLPTSCDIRLTSWKAGTRRKLKIRRSLI
jgi:hypothetical protein